MASEFPSPGSPSGWRFTWEALASIPIIRLFLFNSNTKPANQCKNLKVSLGFEQFLLLVSWTEDVDGPNTRSVDFLLTVPAPRVLFDPGSPVDFRVRTDHIEVKLILLLPIDHPVVANFDSVLNLSEEDTGGANVCPDRLQHLSLDSGLNILSSLEGVHFYCKSCSMKLTKRTLRSFMEMPSVNWREVADNWFGACCCSFGGISEKLVTKYANSYVCTEGVCLLDSTSAIVHKDDLVGCCLSDSDERRSYDNEPDLISRDNSPNTTIQSASNDIRGLCQGNKKERENASSGTLKVQTFDTDLENDVIQKESTNTTLFCTSSLISDFPRHASAAHGIYAHEQGHSHFDITNDAQNNDCRGCSHGTSEASSRELMTYQKSLLNGSLGNAFMVTSSNLSKDVEWIEFMCPQCSSLLGAYPCGSNGSAPLDGGIRLFKCYISTDLPVGGRDDIFRKHTLQRMFVSQLLERATDELSFRTVLRDLRTKSPMLQFVLINPNAWCCTGYCLGTKSSTGPTSKISLHPVVKVLFSDCNNAAETQLRMTEEWITKNEAEEVYMLMPQIRELVNSMKAAGDMFPESCSQMQGLLLSSMERIASSLQSELQSLGLS